MSPERTRIVMVVLGLVALVGVVVYIVAQPDPHGTYYTAGDQELFTDPEQTPEGNSSNYFSLLNINSLVNDISQPVLESIRASAESYLLSLPTKPKAMYYVEESLQMSDNKQTGTLKITTIDPFYSFEVQFYNNDSEPRAEAQ